MDSDVKFVVREVFGLPHSKIQFGLSMGGFEELKLS
jgi:hypothetical protein